MTFKDFATSLIGAGNTIVVPVIFALTFLVFVYGVVNFFFLSQGSEEGLIRGRQTIFWGILGMVLLFSVWGVLNLLLSTLGFTH
jgi:hypothetical protein